MKAAGKAGRSGKGEQEQSSTSADLCKKLQLSKLYQSQWLDGAIVNCNRDESLTSLLQFHLGVAGWTHFDARARSGK